MNDSMTILATLSPDPCKEPSRPVVLKYSYTLESPGELLRLLLSR